MVKQFVPNKDGSYTVWDEKEDGFEFILFHWLKHLWQKKWVCKQCNRGYRTKKEASECCWICMKCNKVIHGIKPALNHVSGCEGKNGKKQTRKSI
jgi:hypothetical protein